MLTQPVFSATVICQGDPSVGIFDQVYGTEIPDFRAAFLPSEKVECDRMRETIRAHVARFYQEMEDKTRLTIYFADEPQTEPDTDDECSTGTGHFPYRDNKFPLDTATR